MLPVCAHPSSNLMSSQIRKPKYHAHFHLSTIPSLLFLQRFFSAVVKIASVTQLHSYLICVTWKAGYIRVCLASVKMAPGVW